MIALLKELSAIAGAAFAAEGLSQSFGQVTRSDRPDLAQFQCNGALAAAKAAKANPRAIAEKVAARLKADPLFAKVEIAGPGFINLNVTDVALSSRGAALANDQTLGAPQTGKGKALVIDFGGPNIAKPMAVHHLRSSVIGDSLQRLFRATGWTVTSDIHLGDWGLQMGQLISEIKHRQLAPPIYFDDFAQGPFPDVPQITMEVLEEIYPAASAACKNDPMRLQEARAATADLQAYQGNVHKGYRALWEHFRKISQVGLAREFGSLGIRFDLWKGESDVYERITPMLMRLHDLNLLENDQGARIMRVAENTDKKEVPPLILVTSDGSTLYGTTDLATIEGRVQALAPDLILYVVDQRQHLHFEQVFRAAERAGLAGKATLEHAGFGTMNGTDGKPFKTRAGGVMKLFDLIAMVTAEAEKRLAEQGIGAEYPPEERADIARKVGIATLKFADLSNYRLTDYVFDIERFSKFEGKTGPYLQYAAVRIQSILRRAAEQGFSVGEPAIHSAEERALFLQLLALPDAMESAEERRAPNILCDYAFTLAQAYSRFYAEHHILSETDAGLRATRLGLGKLTLAVLVKVLGLLGIEVPQRM